MGLSLPVIINLEDEAKPGAASALTPGSSPDHTRIKTQARRLNMSLKGTENCIVTPKRLRLIHSVHIPKAS